MTERKSGFLRSIYFRPIRCDSIFGLDDGVTLQVKAHLGFAHQWHGVTHTVIRHIFPTHALSTTTHPLHLGLGPPVRWLVFESGSNVWNTRVLKRLSIIVGLGHWTTTRSFVDIRLNLDNCSRQNIVCLIPRFHYIWCFYTPRVVSHSVFHSYRKRKFEFLSR